MIHFIVHHFDKISFPKKWIYYYFLTLCDLYNINPILEMENHRTKDLHPIPEPNNMPKRLSSVDGESKSKDDFVSAEIEDNTASRNRGVVDLMNAENTSNLKDLYKQLFEDYKKL